MILVGHKTKIRQKFSGLFPVYSAKILDMEMDFLNFNM